jgi:NAD(P)-dependent dehydrogenase (short-subunit alcohol dehydrogenase family)
MAKSSHKRIVITGTTRGLGHALAEGFARLGHTVIGCGRDVGAIKTLRADLGAPHEFEAVDVSREDQVRAWAERFLATSGAPDLLINNAAVINRNAPTWLVPTEEFDRLVDVNIKGVANVLRHVVPAMVARGSGVIVNLSSYWGRSVAAEVAPYCASKWAIEGLTRALAQELPKDLAAVPLNPGIIDTAMLRSTFGEQAGHYLSPSEWAESAVPFLLGLGRKDNGKPLTVPGQ